MVVTKRRRCRKTSLLGGSNHRGLHIGVPYFGVLITRILVFRVLYWGPLFSETPMWVTTRVTTRVTARVARVWALGFQAFRFESPEVMVQRDP